MKPTTFPTLVFGLGLALGIALRAGPPDSPAAHVGQPLTVTVCGGEDFGPALKDIDAKLEVLKQMGVTSIQTYIFWNRVEKSPGVLDWSLYDAEARLYQKHGIKWVPFIIMSPWYATPEHVRRDPQITMYRCLEHGRESLIPSIWSPRLKEYARDYLRKFAEHYRPMGLIESVNIGISGDYGEAIYSVIGNWPGAYHSHAGYWCGDKLATEDFRRHLKSSYPGGINALNQAWKSGYASFDEVQPFNPAKAPSERAWQEFLSWYRGAMTAYSDFCLQTTRQFFPENDIYLCTGGDMAPEHGSDFFGQAQVAAKYHAGLRITNEASSFPVNVRYTRMVASACRHYGAYFGHEPAAVVTPAGTVGRVFNAVTSGANQLFNYYSNALVDETAAPTAGTGGRHLARFHGMLKMTSPLIDTAVYHPNLSLPQVLNADTSRLAMTNFGDLLADIRRFVDYDLLDDRLILDGALDGKSVLIIAGAMVMDARTTARINQWVRQGGVVFVLASRPVDWDGSTATMDSLVGFTPATDEVDGITEHVVPKPQALPSIASLKDVTLTKGYTNLSGDCEFLLAMRYDPRIGVAWRRKVGAGAVYAYYGPMDLKQQESTWMVSNRLPLRFMQDSFQACIAEKLLPQAPPTLNLDVPDVYKVLTTSGLWVLNMGAEPRDISYQGVTIHVPALDIVHQPAGPGSR